MRMIKTSSFTALLALLSAPTISCNAFTPKKMAFQPRSSLSSSTAVLVEVPTTPIPGMKPGTSGLRKKVEIWQGVDPANTYYIENFIQSLLDTAASKNDGKMPQTQVSKNTALE